jgi:hypothetical protein
MAYILSGSNEPRLLQNGCRPTLTLFLELLRSFSPLFSGHWPAIGGLLPLIGDHWCTFSEHWR